MEIIVNDKSINEQFDKDSFMEYCKDNLIPIFKKFDENKVDLLKTYTTFSRKITLDKSLNDFLYERNNPIIDSFKGYLIQIIKEPFWDDNSKTDLSKEYNYNKEDIPNCITEAFSRKASLLSFLDGGYNEDNVEIICEGEKHTIDNFSTYSQCEYFLKKIGIIDVWDDSNSFFVKSIGYKFEIRFEEGHHNIAHFHLSNKDDDLSISIPDADIIKGKTRKERKIISWALTNMDNIKKLWNSCHPEKMVE